MTTKGTLRFNEEQYREHAAKVVRWKRASEIVETTSGGAERRAGEPVPNPATPLAVTGAQSLRGQIAGTKPGPLTLQRSGPPAPSPGTLRPAVSAAPIYPLVGLCRAAGLPEPVPEYRFDTVRRFRFDYAWPLRKVAVEIDGGVWTQGRHTRGLGFIEDQRKTNLAAKLGWYVMRYTPDRLGECIADLRIMFAGDAA